MTPQCRPASLEFTPIESYPAESRATPGEPAPPLLDFTPLGVCAPCGAYAPIRSPGGLAAVNSAEQNFVAHQKGLRIGEVKSARASPPRPEVFSELTPEEMAAESEVCRGIHKDIGEMLDVYSMEMDLTMAMVGEMLDA